MRNRASRIGGRSICTRPLVAEPLEKRYALSVGVPLVGDYGFTNPANAYDVDANGVVTPSDVLLLINRINAGGSGPLGDDPTGMPPFFDVNGDGYLTPLDVLIVINLLNSNQPVSDPVLGFSLVSWWSRDARAQAWEAAVNELDEAGFDSVQFVTLRFVNPDTGAILPLPDPKIPPLEGIEAGITRAKELGHSVTVNAFVERRDFSWRGNLAFAGPAADEFFRGLTEYVVDVAEWAESLGVDRLVVASELDRIASEPANLERWDAYLDAVDAVFSGEIGYASNWDRYDDPNIAAAIWNHPAIDFLGIDAYPRVASAAEATPIQSYPDETFIGLVQGRWTEFLDEVTTFAAQQKDGRGMTVVLTEVGFAETNLTTTAPWAGNVSVVPDPNERVNAYDALLRASRGRGSQISDILVWHWDMPGTTGSPYLHNANDPAGAFLASFASESSR